MMGRLTELFALIDMTAEDRKKYGKQEEVVGMVGF